MNSAERNVEEKRANNKGKGAGEHLLALLGRLLLLSRRGGGRGSLARSAAQVLVRLVPVIGCLVVGAPVLVEFALDDQRLLRLGLRAEAPAARVRIPLHDHALDLGNNLG